MESNEISLKNSLKFIGCNVNSSKMKKQMKRQKACAANYFLSPIRKALTAFDF